MQSYNFVHTQTHTHMHTHTHTCTHTHAHMHTHTHTHTHRWMKKKRVRSRQPSDGEEHKHLLLPTRHIWELKDCNNLEIIIHQKCIIVHVYVIKIKGVYSLDLCPWLHTRRRKKKQKGRLHGWGSQNFQFFMVSFPNFLCGRQAGLEPDQSGELPEHAPRTAPLTGDKTRRTLKQRRDQRRTRGRSCDCTEKCMVHTYWRSRKRGGRKSAVER